MATSWTAACNRALRANGANRITALSDDSEEARIVNELYEDVRTAVLRAHPWRWAKTRSQLSQLTATPDFEFDHYYTVPSACVRIVAIYGSDGTKVTESDAWKRELYVTSTGAEYQVIATDEDSPIYAVYIRNVTNIGHWDALAVEAFVARLSAEIAERLGKSSDDQDRFWKLYTAKVREAKHVDSTEAAQTESWTSTWENAKF